MTINVKNNRTEAIAGKVTFSNDLKYTGKFLPKTVSAVTVSATAAASIPVYDAAGVLLGYVQVFPEQA